MSKINSGILYQATPLSKRAIEDLEYRVFENGEIFAYLDENKELCFSMPAGVDAIKNLAWHNAYELYKDGGTFVKQAYKKTGSNSYLLDKTYTKWYIDYEWEITHNTPAETAELEGSGQEYYTTAPSVLSFRSTAPLDEFQGVQVNGQTVDPSNYTLEEGSTIVKLSTDFLKTLDIGTHEISVISNSQTATGDFTVAAPELNEYGFYYNYPYSFTTANYPEYDWGYSAGNYCIIFRDASTVCYFFKPSAESYWAGTDSEYYIDGASVVMEASGLSSGLSFSGSFTNAGKTLICDTFCVVTGGGGLSAEWLESSGIRLEMSKNGLLVDRHCLYSYNDINKDYKVEFIFSKQETAVIAREILNSPVTGLREFSNTGYITTLVLPDTITSIPSHFIWYDDVLTDIVFKGTVAQWDAINKGTDWIVGTPIAYVQCSDGQVAI